MHIHAERAQGSKNRSLADAASKVRKEGGATFQLVDNRPEAGVQRRLLEAANSSPRVKQLAAFQETANNIRQTRPFARAVPGGNPGRGVIQRQLDLSGVGTNSILERAINIFHEIESDDISQEEFDDLKAERQRFMPILGRFATAQNTTLLVRPASKSLAGDMAVTMLGCRTNAGKSYDYDDDKNDFLMAMGEKSITDFLVRVLFWDRRVTGEESKEPGGLKNVGTILQAFTHELSVHAENMLDFTEDYWAYHNGTRSNPPPLLGTSSEEHAAFKSGKVKRYEYMSARVKSRGDKIGVDFGNREGQDKISAN
ncbi:MAG TPA: hypothetical protein VF811_00825 [Parasulfuritortus sp.]